MGSFPHQAEWDSINRVTSSLCQLPTLLAAKIQQRKNESKEGEFEMSEEK